ncbi:ABC transporter ATP-binding protein [Lysinibacillus sp. FSL K6-0232]|uniref:ABC transporter ATP-binding protein n=1 Tax=unclassified Lysinibacillus TaxID=2636778 RepID=UPI0030F69D02
MLIFQNVSYKKILYDVTIEIPKTSYIVGRNNIGKTDLLHMLFYQKKLTEGEIHLQENLTLGHSVLGKRQAFFLVPEDFSLKWNGFKLHTIYRLFTKKSFVVSGLCLDYQLDGRMYFQQLNQFLKLVFYTHIAMTMRIPIILYDEPFKILDFEERSQFFDFLKKWENKLSFVITGNRMEPDISQSVQQTFLLDNGTLTPLKGGEKYANL